MNIHRLMTSQDGFEAAINSRHNKPAEMIAKFLDAKLRAGNKAASFHAYIIHHLISRS